MIEHHRGAVLLAETGTQRIVIIDDDDMIRQLLRIILREEGHQVVGETGRGPQVMTLVKRVRPTLVFLDINLAGGNGLDLLSEIRVGAPGVRVVMISSAATQANVQAATAAGAGGFVVKPFSADKVLHTVRRLLGQGCASSCRHSSCRHSDSI